MIVEGTPVDHDSRRSPTSGLSIESHTVQQAQGGLPAEEASADEDDDEDIITPRR